MVAYDPNIRLNVEPDIQRWRDTLLWMLPRTALLKVSDEGLGLLHPGLAADEPARQWLAAGVALVVVTRGGEGASAWTLRRQVQTPSVPVAVVDTVGAGDTFQAALLTALAERGHLTRDALPLLSADELAAVMAFATQAAAITCSRRGADLPRRQELPAL